MKLLVVDEDAELCAMLRELFEESGYAVETEPDPERGLRRAQIEPYDLLILDSVALLKLVREHSQMPVLMLSAKADRDDRVSGLQAGADDYLPKPFYPEELLARLRAGDEQPDYWYLCSSIRCRCWEHWPAALDGTPPIKGVLEYPILPPLYMFQGRCRVCLTLLFLCGECVDSGRLDKFVCPACGDRGEPAGQARLLQ